MTVLHRDSASGCPGVPVAGYPVVLLATADPRPAPYFPSTDDRRPVR